MHGFFGLFSVPPVPNLSQINLNAKLHKLDLSSAPCLGQIENMLTLKTIGVTPGTFSIDTEEWQPTQFMQQQLISAGISAELQAKQLKEFLRQTLKHRSHHRYSQVDWEIEFLKYCKAVSGEPLKDALANLLKEVARIKNLYESYQHAANPDYRAARRQHEWMDGSNRDVPKNWEIDILMREYEPMPSERLNALVKNEKKGFYRQLDEFNRHRVQIETALKSAGLGEYLGL